ncbi:type IV pilus modification protein PilV [Psychrobacter sp. FBL11]|uniref:Type IV pilus modification protein PilV n=1 Tax=Psychrobacter saeujeotis TaxID=3143436 RepID=A0ABU9X9E1_9GAMM|nr:type IV pilus modification protein PilV [uncultured Psychrobacter sp.]
MKTQTTQAGVGLIEVMVALLLLTVAVLGFSAMQMSAIKATDESLMRTRSISTMKSLSESMRILPNTGPIYREQVNSVYKSSKKVNSDYDISAYCKDVKTYSTAAPDCNTDDCSIDEMVNHNVGIILVAACEKEVALNMEVCTDTNDMNERQCIIAAWSQTKPTMNDEKYSCTDANGTYKPNASCFIMEAY